MKKATAIFALGVSLGAGGAAVTSSHQLSGTSFVRFTQQLPDGGSRDLGRTGCYDLSKVQATVESCSTSR